jgi:rhodanese-related sulfurtransferase
VALHLAKHGIKQVYPLAGGMDAWLEHGFPAEVLEDGRGE